MTTPPSGASSRPWLLRLGLAAVAVAVVLGLVLVQRFGRSYRDALDVAGESAEVAAEATAPIEQITTDLVELAGSIETGIAEAHGVVASAQQSVSELGAAAAGELADTADGVSSLADRVAGVIESIEQFIPGDRESAAEDMRQIADGLAPTAGQLRELGAQLETTAAALEDASATLGEIGSTVSRLAADLDALSPSVADLSANVDRLVARVDDANERVDGDLWLARVLIVLIGVVLAVGLVLAARPPGDSAARD